MFSGSSTWNIGEKRFHKILKTFKYAKHTDRKDYVFQAFATGYYVFLKSLDLTKCRHQLRGMVLLIELVFPYITKISIQKNFNLFR